LRPSGRSHDRGQNVLSEIAKLARIRALSFPPDLFAGVSRKRLLWCKRRLAVEDLSEIRRHPPQVRYSLLAAFCTVCAEEITDTLVELLIAVIHKMGSRAKHIVNKEVIRDIKRVQGKNRLLYEVASASLENPDESVRKVVYPVAPEQTLRDLVAEYKQGGLYDQRIQTIMRGSYSNHYRRMVPHIVQALSFRATNETSKPITSLPDTFSRHCRIST
jgi:DNA-binding cell septation regulator SpoVG